MKIIITQGLPASGKTTWAKEYAKKHSEFKRINRDDLRAMIDDSQWSENREKFIRLVRDMMIKLAFMQGYSVILDETFLIPSNQKQIGELIQTIADDLDINVDVEIKTFDTSPEECCLRDSKRTGSAKVGDDVIWNFYNKYVSSTKEN